ncbi:MAG: hypothetical protein DRQ39_10775, partial [Gammaproteobacteria bacterium]
SNAIAGKGGQNGYNNSSGLGGDAVSTISLTGTNTVTARSNSIGGNAGRQDQSDQSGNIGGNSNSQAIANSTNGIASAYSESIAGNGTEGLNSGEAISTAQADSQNSNRAYSNSVAKGQSVTSTSTASTSGGKVIHVSSTASAEILNNTSRTNILTEAEVEFDSSPVSNAWNSSAQALVDLSDTTAGYALSGHIESEAKLSGANEYLLHGFMSGGHSLFTSSTGDIEFSSSIDLEYDMSNLEEANLMIALLELNGTGSGFTNLRFQIFEEESSVLDMSFVDLANAVLFFDDNILNLGSWFTGQDGVLNLKFQLDGLANIMGDTVKLDFLVATQTVPLPTAFWLFVSALGLAGWMRRKKV